MDESEEKERLTNGEFAELISHLPLEDLLLIEYRIDDWKFLIQAKDPGKKLYGCSVCGVVQSGIKNLYSHIDGKKHKFKMQSVKQLYHSEYTYEKSESNPKPTKSSQHQAPKVINKGTESAKQASNSDSKKTLSKRPNLQVIPLAKKSINSGETQSVESISTERKNVKSELSPSSKKLQTTQLVHSDKLSSNNDQSTTAVGFQIKTEKLDEPENGQLLNNSNSAVKTNVIETTNEDLHILPGDCLHSKDRTLLMGGNSISEENSVKKTVTGSSSASKINHLRATSNTSSAKEIADETKEDTAIGCQDIIADQSEEDAAPDSQGITTEQAEENASTGGQDIADQSEEDAAPDRQDIIADQAEENASTGGQDIADQSEEDVAPDCEDIIADQAIEDAEAEEDAAHDSQDITADKAIEDALTGGQDIKEDQAEEDAAHDSQEITADQVMEDASTDGQDIADQAEEDAAPDSQDITADQAMEDALTSGQDIIEDQAEEDAAPDRQDITADQAIEDALTGGQDTTEDQAGEDAAPDSQDITATQPIEDALPGGQDIIEDQAEEDAAPDSQDITADQAKEDEGTDCEDNPVMVKNPFALKSDKNVDKTSTSTSVIEIIVIDEEDDDEADKNKHGKRANSGEDLKQPPAKKQKTIPNMAKASGESVIDKVVSRSSKKEPVVDIAEKPRYQSNIIIVPTVDKNRKSSSTSQMSIKRQPTFSTKTFSCKLSDDKILGLIGVEYVIKILKSPSDLSPKFECGLCELILDGFGMQNHLMSYKHRLKFCEKHFPTAIRQCRQYIGKLPENDVQRVMLPILEKLAVSIEQHHGRDLPYECLERDFNMNRHEILSKVFSCRHASEQYGPTFTHVVNSKDIDQLISQGTRSNFIPQQSLTKTAYASHSSSAGHGAIPNSQQFNRYNPFPEFYHQQSTPNMHNFNQYYPQTSFVMPSYPPSADVDNVPIDDETHKIMVDDFLRGNKRNSRSVTERETERYHRPDIRPRLSGRSPKISRSDTLSKQCHDENMRKSLSPLRDNDIWQAYRHLVDQKVNELNELFKMYRKDPEMHPLYNEEWEKFWKRRKEELITAGLDHRTYNYQPEWVRFFNARIEELYVESLENIKIESRERLCLPMTNNQLTDLKYHIRITEEPTDRITEERTNRIIEERANRMIEERANRITEEPTIRLIEEQTNRITEEPTNRITRKPTNRITEVSMESRSSREVQQTPEIVSVLRLMTALEEHLGSLGPKIIELLSKALQVEKVNPDKINKIILTTENCTLLETAMEKFKGLLIAGFLEGAKERALKKAVEGIQLLLDHSSKTFNWNEEESGSSGSFQEKHFNPTPPKPETSFLPPSQKNPLSRIIAQADKKDLATRLAAILTAQGKSNMDPEQLQHIISLYMLIVKKKQETSSTVESQFTTPIQKSLAETMEDLINSTQNSQQNTPLNRNITGCVPNIGQLGVSQSNRNTGVNNMSRNYAQQNYQSTTATLNNFRFGASNQASYSAQLNSNDSGNMNRISADTNLYQTNRFNSTFGGNLSFSNSLPTLSSGLFFNSTTTNNSSLISRNDSLMNEQGRLAASNPPIQKYNSAGPTNNTNQPGPNWNYRSNYDRGAGHWR